MDAVDVRERNNALMSVPSHLSEPSKEWMRELLDEFDFNPAEMKLLIIGADALDRASQARRTIRREGLTYLAKPHDTPRPHPAVAIEAKAQATFSKVCRQLHLPDDGPETRGGARVHRGARPIRGAVPAERRP